MTGELHIGDTTELLATLTDENGEPVDVGGATLTFALQTPAGEVRLRAAIAGTADPSDPVNDGSDGRFHYVTHADDLDVAGVWHVQGVVVSGERTWHTDIAVRTVHANL